MTPAAADGVNRALTQPVALRGWKSALGRPYRVYACTDRTGTGKLQWEPDLSQKPEITVYTSAVCAYCVAAKNFLRSKGLSWNEVRIDSDPSRREQMVALTRRTTVPQIFIGQTHVGGYDDMMALHRAGKLELLLEGGAE
jgi:glutaredoxin 3